MPQDFYSKLEKLLKKDPRFVDQEGDLLKSNVIDVAYRADKKLVELLFSQREFKVKFFSKIKDVLVFNINDFINYIQDKNFLADSYTKYRNKIGLNIDGKFLDERKEVALVWPFKDCVLEGGMTKEDEKRKEIFFNEILAQDEIDKLFTPKVLTNWERYTQKGREKVKMLKRNKDGIIRENLIIKGNNLLALYSLKQQFQGKIKLIYIDPPYNREDESFYNDSFKHSTWLTFMKNRLEIAKELLKNDGVIFVQCDDREHAYLKVLMDEIFDRSNFITTITCKVKGPSGVASGSQFIFDTNEYILVYKKSVLAELPTGYKIEKEIIDHNSRTVENYYYMLERISIKDREKIKELPMGEGTIKISKIPDKDFSIKTIPKKDRTQDFYLKNFDKIYRLQTLSGGTEKRVLKEIPDNGMYLYEYTPTRGRFKGTLIQNFILNKGAVTFLKDFGYIKEEANKKTPIRLEYVTNSWMEGWWQGVAKQGSVKLKSGKKPEPLLQRIIDMSTEKNEIVLDFFMGTGTTCAVAHKMGRQYIGIEQLDYGKNSAEVRLKNVINGDSTGISKAVDWKGGGEFVYCELMKYNEEFIGKIQKAKGTKELLKIWVEMKEKSFLSYNVDIKKFDETIGEFKKLPLNKQKHILLEILNKNQLYVNLSDIKDKEFKVNKEDERLSKEFYKG